ERVRGRARHNDFDNTGGIVIAVPCGSQRLSRRVARHGSYLRHRAKTQRSPVPDGTGKLPDIPRGVCRRNNASRRRSDRYAGGCVVTNGGFTESVVEQAALAWLESVGWRVAHGPEIAPDSFGAERDDYGEVILKRRLRDALARLNPAMSADAL